ncbi:MAG: YhgE/Pip domain-containing protein [Clostridia bacterium]|nr:YhgE/Pip domain-containing protein [Clostridia bacterium]
MNSKKIMKVVIFVVVILIPMIYSFFYLKSYWDPYGSLEDMKVAIVNLDRGYNGENQGQKIVNTLQDKKVVDICNVSKPEAEDGLKNEKYYAVITIPENFSKDLSSAGEIDKKVVKITYSPNQKMNYLASQIINRVVTATEAQIKSEISSKTVETLAENIKEVPESLKKISDGSEQILNGAESLSGGLNDLNNGVNTLKNSYSEFDKGLENASNGSKQLNNGINQIDGGAEKLMQGGNTLNSAISKINEGASTLAQSGNNGIVELQNGIEQISTGSTQLNEGIKLYVAGSDSLGTNATAYIDGVNGLNTNTKALLTAIAQYGTVSEDQNVKALAGQAQAILASGAYEKLEESGTAIKGGAQQLVQSGNSVKVGAQSLADGAQQLQTGASGLGQLANGMLELKNGLAQVQEGTTNLNNGISTLENGTKSIKTGSTTLMNGLETLDTNSEKILTALNTLSEGTSKAYNGSKTLQNGVETLKNGVDEGIEKANSEIKKLDGLSDHVSNPVEIVEEDYGDVPSYGIAFTPLFLSIGLWVGALMCYVVLYYDQKHRFGIFDSKYENKIKQNLAYLAVGVVQGIITAFLLKVTLGYSVDNGFVYYAVSALMGLCFTSIIQFLIRTFGDVGKFLALIILVLQLAAAGGTFPVDIIDKGFRWLNPLLPMTYTIKLVKDCVIATDTNFIAHNCFIVLVYVVMAVLLTFVGEIVKKNRKNES